jgi:ATP-binding cassette subfamily B protein
MTARLLLSHLDRYRARYLGGIALLLGTNLCGLGIPWVLRRTIDEIRPGAGGGDAGLVLAGAVGIVALAGLQALSRTASRHLFLGASQRVEADIRERLFALLLSQPAVFYQRYRTGDIMSRATNDLQSVAMLIGFGLLTLLNTAIVYAGTLAAMLWIDVWLTVVALAPYPLLIGLGKRFTRRMHADTLAVQEQLARLSTALQENLGGVAVVRAYTIEDRQVAAFRALNDEHLRRVLRQVRTQGAFSPFMGVIGGIGALTVLWFGGGAVMGGRTTLGALVAFSAYLGYLAWPTTALGWVLGLARRGFTAMERILEILNVEPAIADGPGTTAAPPAGLAGEIEIRRLTFAYEPDRAPALRDVSLHVRAGSWVAIVGPTGAGKSTLAGLIARLWDPPAGSVFLDGREIHELPLATLRRAIGYVPQEAFLFSKSLAANVVFGGAAERLERAGRVAGLEDDVRTLPEGWSTVVGERGLTLSGGQRQRATLARAILRDPRILILDDAFAAVDAVTEDRILRELTAERGGRTLILITHRLRHALRADRVVVLEEGRIVETGTHGELLAANGAYARLWRREELLGVIGRAAAPEANGGPR